MQAGDPPPPPSTPSVNSNNIPQSGFSIDVAEDFYYNSNNSLHHRTPFYPSAISNEQGSASAAIVTSSSAINSNGNSISNNFNNNNNSNSNSNNNGNSNSNSNNNNNNNQNSSTLATPTSADEETIALDSFRAKSYVAGVDSSRIHTNDDRAKDLRKNQGKKKSTTVENAALHGSSAPKQLSLFTLVAITYFLVAGGPFGLESLVGSLNSGRRIPPKSKSKKILDSRNFDFYFFTFTAAKIATRNNNKYNPENKQTNKIKQPLRLLSILCSESHCSLGFGACLLLSFVPS